MLRTGLHSCALIVRLCAAGLCVAGLCVAVPVAHAGSPLAVIVHPDRVVHLTVEDLARVYLKKRRFWGDGAPIIPVNLESGNAAREYFSQRVLGRDSHYLSAYWNQMYFQGIFPPVALSSSAAVKRYVAAERNAIGYVDASEVDASVRVVLLLE